MRRASSLERWSAGVTKSNTRTQEREDRHVGENETEGVKGRKRRPLREGVGPRLKYARESPI